ncbi:MAG: T9SS type A sorting domain-containing protein [Bacteroidia bacterium]
MKSRLLFLLLLLPLLSFAQSYLLNNPEWTVRVSCSFSGPNCIQTDTYNYYVKGDTVIAHHRYKKLFKKGQTTFAWYTSPPVPSNCQGVINYYDTIMPLALLRDTLKTMFICDPSNQPEKLLYNFNLSVGDTLPLTFNNSTHTLVVTAMDSILVRNQYRKRFYINHTSEMVLEGIGFSGGLIESFGMNMDCGASGLNCYSLNDSALYPAPGPTCRIPLGIAVPEEEKQQIELIPNPADQQARIYSPYKMGDMLLYNTQGKSLIPLKEVGNAILINTSSLPDGLYLIMGTTSKGPFSRKLLVQH